MPKTHSKQLVPKTGTNFCWAFNTAVVPCLAAIVVGAWKARKRCPSSLGEGKVWKGEGEEEERGKGKIKGLR